MAKIRNVENWGRATAQKRYGKAEGGRAIPEYSKDTETWWRKDGNVYSPMDTSAGSPSEKRSSIRRTEKLKGAIEEMGIQMMDKNKSRK